MFAKNKEMLKRIKSKSKNKSGPPSMASLLTIANRVVKEVNRSSPDNTPVQKLYKKEMSSLKKALEEKGFRKDTITSDVTFDNKGETLRSNTRNLLQRLLKRVPSSAGAKIQKGQSRNNRG